MFGIISISVFVGVVLGVICCYWWIKLSTKNRFGYLEEESRAKAKVIEQEAQLILKSAHIKIKEQKIELEEKFLEKVEKIEKRNRELIVQKKS